MAGGLASVLSDQILSGPLLNIDFTKYDPRRFLPLHYNAQYLFERVPEVTSVIFFKYNYNFF